MTGYVLLGRDVAESALWSKPPYYMKLWTFFLFKAYFKDKGGLKRGEFRTNYDEISDALSYGAGYRRVRISKKEIYRALRFLKEGGGEANGDPAKVPLIEVRRINGGIIVRLLNYEKTQNPQEYEIPTEGEEKGVSGAEGVRTNKEKRNKERRNKSNAPRNRFVNYEPRTWDFEGLEEMEQSQIEREAALGESPLVQKGGSQWEPHYV